jgi:alkylation response protein AidB-like acyl-CoA dehydrogenase
MNLEPTDEQQQLRDTVRRFLAEKASTADHVRPMLDDPTGTTAPVWSGLTQLGATGLLIPVEHDGAGMTMAEVGVVCEELGAALNPGPFPSSAVAAARVLARFEAVDVPELYSGIADGSLVATVAPLSPGTARATLRSRHGELAVSGTFDRVPDAAAADTLFVLADDGGRVTLVATPASAARVMLEPGIDQTRKLFRVELDDAPARVLATAELGAVQALVDDVIIAAAADAVGAGRRLLELTVEYAKVRKQFGASRPSPTCASTCTRRSNSLPAASCTHCGPPTMPTTANGISPRYGSRRSRGGWPPWAIRRSRSSAASASRGSTTLTSTSSGC